ncbi:N-acetylmuramoyl-L-alanine amidase [Antrihabitans sp. YC2-6]|uniref:N-acetylmuramoyl-L-alanine amidase n=1 Tax=Antrihabitans sp. YC2-6 TaxID=2799498 RepID=UPI0018F5B929|nr:N-acetylmuramoyl-L-alanine amidase [Antrihabitans sp. YC2-6]MBJ8343502.1 N-acetylmuramoyl-L-alanine amidase [Antrihabitans sp. YC2-6]
MKKSIIKAGLVAAVAGSMILPTTAHAEPAPDVSTKLSGKTIFLDPGHQGTNHTEDMARQVDDGRGGTKECQTSGMTTPNGVAEHTINWKVSQLVKAAVESLGAKVVMSRNDDEGWGGCIDERAAAANASGADVAVSIHADGAPPADHGFHLIVPQLPIPNAAADQAQSGGGAQLSKDVRDAYVRSGFSPANYAGAVDGLQTRADVAGPALTTVPLVFVEMGNGANPEDAQLLETGEGQLKHAIAITTGVVSYLLGQTTVVTPVRGTPPPTTGDSTTPRRTSPDTTTQRSRPSVVAPEEDSSPLSALDSGSAGEGLTSMAMSLLSPLLEELGLGSVGSLVDDEMVGMVTDLASQMIGIALSK